MARPHPCDGNENQTLAEGNCSIITNTLGKIVGIIPFMKMRVVSNEMAGPHPCDGNENKTLAEGHCSIITNTSGKSFG